MDATTIAAVEEMAPMDLDSSTAALLFAQSDIGGTTGQEEVARIASACEEAGAAVVAISEDPAEGRMLLAARRLAYPALERKGATLLDDIAVPISRIPDLLERISAVAEDHEVTIGTFGHAGEGNMHPTIVYRRGDPQDIARARRAFIAIVELAIDLGGTVTGEHGVGTLKRALLTHAHRDLASLYAGVKGVFDPDGLLNPGKVL
jgi:glycolate oxidase